MKKNKIKPFSTISVVYIIGTFCFRRVNGDTWRDLLQGMQTSSERITAMSWNRLRSYGAEKQMPHRECPTLSSPPVIHSPFTCQGNTRWDALLFLTLYLLSLPSSYSLFFSLLLSISIELFLFHSLSFPLAPIFSLKPSC